MSNTTKFDGATITLRANTPENMESFLVRLADIQDKMAGIVAIKGADIAKATVTPKAKRFAFWRALATQSAGIVSWELNLLWTINLDTLKGGSATQNIGGYRAAYGKPAFYGSLDWLGMFNNGKEHLVPFPRASKAGLRFPAGTVHKLLTVAARDKRYAPKAPKAPKAPETTPGNQEGPEATPEAPEVTA